MNSKYAKTPAIGTGEGLKVTASNSSSHQTHVPRPKTNAPKIRTIGAIKDHSKRCGPIIPDDIINLGPKAIAVYAATKSFLHRDSGDCHPGIETICKKGHVSRRTVEKYRPIIAELGEWAVHMQSGRYTYYEFPDYPLTFTPWQRKKKKKQSDPDKRSTGNPVKRAQGSEQSDTQPRQTSTGYPVKRAQGTPLNEHTEPIETNQCKLTNPPIAPQRGKGSQKEEDDPLTSMTDNALGEHITNQASRKRHHPDAAKSADLETLYSQIKSIWNGQVNERYKDRALKLLAKMREHGWNDKSIVQAVKKDVRDNRNLTRRVLDNTLESLSQLDPPVSDGLYSLVRYQQYLDEKLKYPNHYVMTHQHTKESPESYIIANTPRSWAYAYGISHKGCTADDVWEIANHLKDPDNKEQAQRIEELTTDFLANESGKSAEKQPRKRLPVAATQPDNRRKGLHAI